MSIPELADPATPGLAIETRGLSTHFARRTAVENVDPAMPEGGAFGFLGPNGAGKTTLIRMLLGLTGSSAGMMFLLGRPVPEERAEGLQRVGAIVEDPCFHSHLTGRETLRFAAAARGTAAARRIDGARERVGLAERADDRVKSRCSKKPSAKLVRSRHGQRMSCSATTSSSCSRRPAASDRDRA